MTELCQKTDIIDKNFKISDIDLALKASKFSLSNINTSYGLVRHEFVEFLIRVALDKYFRSGICKSETEAILMFFNSNFLKIQAYDQDKWRWDRFFTQECEDVLIDNRDILQNVFDLNSGKKAKPGEKKFMQVEDFLSICQMHELMSESFNLRQIILSFHMALMTHVDELNGIAHTQANRLEFTEALARVVDYFDSPNPEHDITNYIYSNIPLEVKLRNVFEKSFSRYKTQKKVRN